MTTPWQGLPLDAEEQERLALAIPRLTSGLGDLPREDSSLATGGAGVALLFAYLADAEQSDAHAERAVRLAEDAMSGAVASAPGASLFEGLTGPAWVVAHLDGWLLDVTGGDPNDAIDVAVLELLGEQPWREDYDLISGLVGIGVYALERLPRPAAVHALELIVAHLTGLADHHESGVAWHTRPELLPEHQRREAPAGYDNLGVAHGVPGVIGLLAAVVGAGVAAPEATRLLTGATDWLLAQELPGGGFAPWTGPGTRARLSRSAWCYGDPGVASAVLGAAAVMGREDWSAAAVEIAARAAERSAEECGVDDAGLCHGAAGLTHVFNRLWQQSHDDRFERASRRWLAAALDQLPSITGTGFLEGRAGVALALLAAAGTEPAWDRILLLSSPGG